MKVSEWLRQYHLSGAVPEVGEYAGKIRRLYSATHRERPIQAYELPALNAAPRAEFTEEELDQ